MPSLLGFAFLTLAFPSILCFALGGPPECRVDSDLLRKLPKCQNTPYQYYIAGQMLPPPLPKDPMGRRLKRDAAPADPQQPITLCTPGTETYIKLTRQPLSGDLKQDKAFAKNQAQMSSLVGNAWSWIDREHLPSKGKDGVINKGEGWIVQRTSPQGTHKLLVANAHRLVPNPQWGGHGTMKIVGHEVTWGVLKAALTTLGEFSARHGWTICEFEIWDAMNQVGTAKIVTSA